MASPATATTAPQHLLALKRANVVRLARADLKRQIAEGERTVAEVLLELPEEARSMQVADLLESQHRWGRTRSSRFLAPMLITETKTLEALTERQRRAIAARLDGVEAEEPFAGAVLAGRC